MEQTIGKCPMCGAPMENETCGYCGYSKNQENEVAAYSGSGTQQRIQPQMVQPPMQQPPVMQAAPMRPTNQMVRMVYISPKKQAVALILCLFLGMLGAHKFYVGKIGMGIIYFLTGGLFGIGWIVDIILIAVGSFKDRYGYPLKN